MMETKEDGYLQCPYCGKSIFKIWISNRGMINAECLQCEYTEQLGEEV